MATENLQDVSLTSSIKLTGSYAKDTWYVLTNSLNGRATVVIMNNGVNNDMTTGILYVSILNTATTETGAKTLARIVPLAAGQRWELGLTSDVYVHIQGDTANMCIGFLEIDSIYAKKGPHDSK